MQLVWAFVEGVLLGMKEFCGDVEGHMGLDHWV